MDAIDPGTAVKAREEPQARILRQCRGWLDLKVTEAELRAVSVEEAVVGRTFTFRFSLSSLCPAGGLAPVMRSHCAIRRILRENVCVEGSFCRSCSTALQVGDQLHIDPTPKRSHCSDKRFWS